MKMMKMKRIKMKKMQKLLYFEVIVELMIIEMVLAEDDRKYLKVLEIDLLLLKEMADFDLLGDTVEC